MPPNFLADLQASLRNQGTKSIIAALENYAVDNRAEFGMQAGIAVENLAKLILARLHPSLIVTEGRPFRSLLLAAGWTGESTPSPGEFRTVGAVEAVERVAFLYPSLARYEVDLRYLAEVRNGVAHIGLADLTRVEAAVSGFVAALQVMGKILGWTDRGLFGSHSELALRTAASAERSVARLVAKKIAVAKRRIEKLQELDARAYSVLVGSLEEELAEETDSTFPIRCPVCEFEGILEGDVVHDAWEYEDRDSDGNPLTAMRRRRFDASSFECPLCGLALSGWRQLSAAGIDPEPELEEERASAVEAQEEEMDELVLERRIESLVDLADEAESRRDDPRS